MQVLFAVFADILRRDRPAAEALARRLELSVEWQPRGTVKLDYRPPEQSVELLLNPPREADWIAFAAFAVTDRPSSRSLAPTAARIFLGRSCLGTDSRIGSRLGSGTRSLRYPNASMA